MSAEVLRRAAALMRERAEAARAGEWFVVPSVLQLDATLVLARWEHDSRRVATCAGSLPEGNEANAEHIASWHPAVALAVADWLMATADRIDAGRDPKNGGRRNHSWRGTREALAVARAYLGDADV